MKEEAEDLKLESFGVELLHAIETSTFMKATTWIKTKKHSFLGFGGFMSRMKSVELSSKETWGMLGSALNVKASMDELARRQEKGEIPEDELRALEQDMSGKMLLATWRGTRFEISVSCVKFAIRCLTKRASVIRCSSTAPKLLCLSV